MLLYTKVFAQREKNLDKKTKTKGSALRKRWIITGIVFLLCAATLWLFIGAVRRKSAAQMREMCRLSEQARISELNADVDQCKDITQTLKLLLQDSNSGEIRNFTMISRNMLYGRNEVACLQLAPDGIVKETYPEDAGYSDKKDLFQNKETREICEYSKTSGAIVVQGPIEMKQGDSCIVVRNPVYLYGQDGKKYFWGFTIAIIRVSKAFQAALNSLSSFGYDYHLYKTNPLDTKYHLVNSSKRYLVKPETVSFVNGGCTWRLDVTPKKGWQVTDSLKNYYYFGTVICVLITALVYLVLMISEDRKKLVSMSEHDSLTMLLNGRKFGEDAAAAAARAASNGCGFGIIYIDLNCFKKINDQYGHQTGNDVLVEVAKRLSASVPYAAYRLGGDEFAVLVTDDFTEDGYRDIIRGIKAFFEAPVVVRSHPIYVSVSAGYAFSSRDGSDPEKLRSIADQWMYREKQKYHRMKEIENLDGTKQAY